MSDLPLDALAAWCETHVRDFHGPVTATKFKGGQSNPTYRLDAASGTLVLRRKPFGDLLPGAHAVDREFRVLTALHGHGVPVAKPLALCMDESVIGAVFYLMAHVDGRIFWDPSLPDIGADQRVAYYDEIMRVLAALHGIDVGAVGLGDFGKSGNYFERQIATWTRQYRASETQRIDAMDTLIARLPARCPQDDGRVALVHGDFRIDNLIWHHEEPRILAIVDWELATLGHPLADLGYFCMALRLPRNPALPGLAGLDRTALGIPDESALIARYQAHGHRGGIDDWAFVLAFSFFRLAAIAQGVAKRAQQGNASNERAAEAGAMTSLLATLGANALT
ncbi:MAG TPA: phosphotransferase family protein [Patescibacteria group bacterium]|nr:phosphotransferase family protein [Patescibacteria group bacterium]